MRKLEANNSISNRNLSKLHSLQELHQAQVKVRRAIRYAEEDFVDEYNSAMNRFSWRETIELALTVFDNVQSISQYIGKGLYTGIAKAFRRKNRREEMIDDQL